ncbi:CrcB protein [Mumia flava]|uniref:Fluoride-specific ion channel FluC n=1 Tax=Mumia flava TaxID=1348852 RepID=A0A0B2BB07_9ACTN|nr:CrcB family protein [Mumia flava]PJJ53957.1 CrcB protein [Mumia flava]
MSRPHHRVPGLVLVVALGGFLGTAARAGLAVWWPHDPDALPVATLTANLLGAFALGLLLEALIRSGDETPGRRRWRLGLGTGVLGGFTTYSSLALEVTDLLDAGKSGLALAYALGTVVVGFVACVLGVLLGARLHHRRRAVALPTDPDAADVDGDRA